MDRYGHIVFAKGMSDAQYSGIDSHPAGLNSHTDRSINQCPFHTNTNPRKLTMEKLFCMQVAAQLTIAACQGMGANVQRVVDPTLQDPGQRNINLEVWEVFRAYYAAIVQAVADNTDWPTPVVSAGQTVPTAVASGIAAAMPSLSSALGSGTLGSLLSGILQAVSSSAPKPAQGGNKAIPAPGTAKTGTTGTVTGTPATPTTAPSSTPGTATPIVPTVTVNTPAVQATVTAGS